MTLAPLGKVTGKGFTQWEDLCSVAHTIDTKSLTHSLPVLGISFVLHATVRFSAL